MGGPWKARGFDPVAWRPPLAEVQTRADADDSHGRHDYVVAIVIGYVAAVVTSVAITLTLMRGGW